MKTFGKVMKVLTTIAAIIGVVYVIATYGEKIVAWCKKTMDSFIEIVDDEEDELDDEDDDDDDIPDISGLFDEEDDNEGGNGGGEIIAEGTPEEVAKIKGSYTGQFIAPLLKD